MKQASERDEKSGSSRILYWWTPPVGPDQSAEVGKSMLTVLVVWFLTLTLIAVIVGVLLAVTG